VEARANTIRRNRSALLAGSAALGLAVIFGGPWLAQRDSDDRDTQLAVDRTAAVSPSSSASPSTPPTASAPTGDTEHQALLTRLQELPKVREDLIAPVQDGQIVLCGINVQGQDDTLHQTYALLVCGLFSTGPDAERLSAGGDPAVITTDGASGPDVRVVDVEFPGTANREERIRHLFPSALVETMTSPQSLPYRPTLDEMLRTAQVAKP
jgi:hypothetical protein